MLRMCYNDKKGLFLGTSLFYQIHLASRGPQILRQEKFVVSETHRTGKIALMDQSIML